MPDGGNRYHFDGHGVLLMSQPNLGRGTMCKGNSQRNNDWNKGQCQYREIHMIPTIIKHRNSDDNENNQDNRNVFIHIEILLHLRVNAGFDNKHDYCQVLFPNEVFVYYYITTTV